MKRILVVEDDSALIKIHTMNLEKRNYEVLAAFCGDEARQILMQEKVDLVLLDITLPDTDGFTLAREIRELSRHNRNVPIIALTSRDGKEDITAARALEFAGYIIKPFKYQNLLEKIRQVLDQRQSVEATKLSGKLVVHLRGALSDDKVDVLHALFEKLIRANVSPIIFDISEAESFDDEIVVVLATGVSKATHDGKKVFFAGAGSDAVYEIVANLEGELFSTLAEAIRAPAS